MQVEVVQAYIEEDACLRMSSIDYEVTGCSQSSQSVPCFLSLLHGRSRILFPYKYTFVVYQPSISKLPLQGTYLTSFDSEYINIYLNYILHMWCLAPEQRAHLSHRATGCTFSSMVVATKPGDQNPMK